MGRSNFNSIVPRAYVIFPIPQVAANTVAGADYTGVSPLLPFGGAPDAYEAQAINRNAPLREFNASNATRPSAPLRAGSANRQGAMYSIVAASGAAGTQLLHVRTNASATMMTNPVSIPTGAQTHVAGLIDCSWRATSIGGAAALSNTDRVSGGNAREAQLFIDSTDASQIVTRPALAMINTPSVFTSPTTTAFAPFPTGHAATYFPGAVKGFYITVPIADADLASGQAAMTTVRRIVCPIDIRLHEVCFSSQVSAAGNSVRLFNVTQNTAITANVTTLTGATATTDVVTGASLLLRNLRKGDVIDLQAITGGTGYTFLAAQLTGHTTGHYNVTSPHLDLALGAAATVDPSSAFRNQSGAWLGRTGFSGPCRGGAAVLQLPVGAAAISQTDFGIGRIVAPFNCFPMFLYGCYLGSGAGNSFVVRNVTRAANILGATAAVASAATAITSGQGTFSTTVINKGDIIETQVTTGGAAGFTAIGFGLLVHVRGHVNSSPAFD
jgi:hypothetical protein